MNLTQDISKEGRKIFMPVFEGKKIDRLWEETHACRNEVPSCLPRKKYWTMTICSKLVVIKIQKCTDICEDNFHSCPSASFPRFLNEIWSDLFFLFFFRQRFLFTHKNNSISYATNYHLCFYGMNWWFRMEIDIHFVFF